MKIMLVSKCIECGWKVMYKFGTKKHRVPACKAERDVGEGYISTTKAIPDADTIPEWCPLNDAVEVI